MSPPPGKPPPLALALVWVSRIFAISLLMVAPGLLGRWLGERWGAPWLLLVGFALGFAGGVAALLAMTGVWGGRR